VAGKKPGVKLDKEKTCGMQYLGLKISANDKTFFSIRYMRRRWVVGDGMREHRNKRSDGDFIYCSTCR